MNVNLFLGPAPGAAASPANEAEQRSAAQQRHRAWQSAMEQAQLANWFKPQPDAAPTGSTSASTPLMALTPRPPAPAADRVPGQAAVEATGESTSEQTVSASRPAVASGSAWTGQRAAPAAPGNAEAAAHAAAHAHEAPAGSAIAPYMRVAGPSIAAQTQITAPEFGGAPKTPPIAPVALAAAPLSLRMFSSAAATGTAAVESAAAAFAPKLPFITQQIAQQIAKLLPTPEVEATESVAAPAAPTARFSLPESTDAPTRLHVEWTAEGARLWLGVDQDQIPRLPALAGQLQQWLATSGVKLLALVCNGRPVYESRDEAPADSLRPSAAPTVFLPIDPPGDRE